MHLHDGELQGLLDRELGGSEEESLRAHVAVCEQCVARMKAMKSAFRETGQLLTALDASPPAMSADQLIEIAQRRHIPARRTPWLLRRSWPLLFLDRRCERSCRICSRSSALSHSNRSLPRSRGMRKLVWR